MQDAEEVGLTAVARVIETGSGYIGVNWERASPEFIEAFRAADLVLAKGQGNFETLDETPGEIFFLLKAKCPRSPRARRQRKRAGLPPQPRSASPPTHLTLDQAFQVRVLVASHLVRYGKPEPCEKGVYGDLSGWTVTRTRSAWEEVSGTARLANRSLTRLAPFTRT